MKRRIAIISSTFNWAVPGGVPTYVDGRAYYLSRKLDVRVFALGSKKEPLEPMFQSMGPAGNFSTNFPWVWWRLLVGLFKFRPNYIEIHNIPVGLPVFLLLRSSYFFHGPAEREAKVEGKGIVRRSVARILERGAVLFSRKLYVVSFAFKDLLRELYPNRENAQRALIRYPRLRCRGLAPIDAECGLADPSNNEGVVFVCVRRLVRRTGVLQLTLAFLTALQRGELSCNAVLHIVGDGPEREAIAAISSRSEKNGNIIVHGRVDDLTRARLYGSADWNIVPSQDLEGFGLVVVEAALFGCPSLVTNVGGLPEVIALLGGIGRVCDKSVNSIAGEFKNLKPLSKQRRQQLCELAWRKFNVKG